MSLFYKLLSVRKGLQDLFELQELKNCGGLKLNKFDSPRVTLFASLNLLMNLTSWDLSDCPLDMMSSHERKEILYAYEGNSLHSHIFVNFQ